MTLSEYAPLKEQVRIGVGSSERHGHLLISLKELFRDTINSSRRFEQIVSIGQLLDVLEIRDHLSEDDVEPLKVIVGRLSNCAVLKRRIDEYQCSHVPREYVNYYASVNEETLRIENITRQPVGSAINTYTVGAIISEIQIERINDTLAANIGDKWRDLGRNLKFKEGDIDRIDRYKNPVKKLLAVYYEREKNHRKWFFNLCEALVKARRKDLCLSLQQIFIE